MEIQGYQKRCFRQYKKSIGYPAERSFLLGNPVEVAVPIETAIEGAMVVGFHPFAKTFEVKDQKDVPLYSAAYPYSSELYFDGREVRTVGGGEYLDEVLEKLSIPRSNCWITTLIKVYLFNSKDVIKYNKLGNFKVAPDEFNYKEWGEKSLPWLEDEVTLANPKIILLSGLETISLFFDVSPTKAKHLIDGEVRELKFGRKKYPVICLQEMELMVNNNKRNPWPEVFERKVLPPAKRSISALSV
jgi:uracil-DNA glycosylase